MTGAAWGIITVLWCCGALCWAILHHELNLRYSRPVYVVTVLCWWAVVILAVSAGFIGATREWSRQRKEP